MDVAVSIQAAQMRLASEIKKLPRVGKDEIFIELSLEGRHVLILAHIGEEGAAAAFDINPEAWTDHFQDHLHRIFLATAIRAVRE